MSKPEIDPNHIVVFTGAGISADQLATFTDDNGLWLKYRVEEVSSAQALKAYPEKVIDFYNFRKQEVLSAHPNPAHIAIAELEKKYRVSVVTSNVDNLHERAGSTQVYHVHGSLFEARHLESDVSFSTEESPDDLQINHQIRVEAHLVA
ncbi:Sir2 family NAD-dependent protein deacetylase [Shewanella xiamenensis]|uniref:Sir2 family NAD-dependent protein deacetylase n=1 Tax=Shewanella sp. LC6 TaxID=2589790 RepID=UPI001965D796|nr:Sir2 family NAD-dependent protein deacetylase [Shewanella sp. LC6]